MRRSTTLRVLVITLAVLGWSADAATGATTGGTTAGGSISGTAFKDTNRNGVRDPGELPWEGHQLYLFDGAGTYRATATTDTSGRYTFTGLADGDYRVDYASPSWWAVRDSWVPTTTGSVRPSLPVRVAGSAVTADFGWRPIVRSSDLTGPLSTYTGPSGLRVESFDDVVSAREVHDAVALGLVGAEARYVTVRFDAGPDSSTVAGWQGSPGSFSGYSAVCYDNYVSWLDGGDQGVSHEYGHAWSLYYDTMVQQDGTLSSYLKARGLAGDPRVNSSYAWSARELIAEDYRQLFGSANARTAAQMNRELPPAADVPGLRDFLATTFTTPPAGGSQAAPPPPPPSPLTVSAPVVTPQPVVKSGTVSFSLSASAAVTLEIRTAGGALVRTLLSSAPQPAGQLSVTWDRKDGAGRRAKAGTYTTDVRARAADGGAARSSSTFSVA